MFIYWNNSQCDSRRGSRAPRRLFLLPPYQDILTGDEWILSLLILDLGLLAFRTVIMSLVCILSRLWYITLLHPRDTEAGLALYLFALTWTFTVRVSAITHLKQISWLACAYAFVCIVSLPFIYQGRSWILPCGDKIVSQSKCWFSILNFSGCCKTWRFTGTSNWDWVFGRYSLTISHT